MKSNDKQKYPFDYKYPIWECSCGYFNRRSNCFFEICFNCGLDWTLNWQDKIINNKVREYYNEQ